MRKSAAEADSAITTRAATAVGLRGENRLKLTNRMKSQKTSTARNATGMRLPDCSYRIRRACRTALAVCMAWLW